MSTGNPDRKVYVYVVFLPRVSLRFANKKKPKQKKKIKGTNLPSFLCSLVFFCAAPVHKALAAEELLVASTSMQRNTR